MSWRSSVSLALVATCLAPAQTPLESTFAKPPQSAKPHTWWHWINGNISKEGITADLEAMKAIGIGGAQIFNVEVGIPAGQVPFMSPQWKDCIAHAFKEAKRLGIEICVHNCAGWSSSGGEWVSPAAAMQNVTWSETRIHGPSTFEGQLPQPPTNHGHYRDIVVLAVKDPKNSAYRIPNIRAQAGFDRGDHLPQNLDTPLDSAIPLADVQVVSTGSGGNLTWRVPEGDWTILRFGHTPTGAVNAPAPVPGRGLEVDKLSRSAMDEFWGGMMATVLKSNGKVGPFGLNNALIDSYEVGSQTWTPKFAEEFEKRRGYSVIKWLPMLTGRVIESGFKTGHALWDYRKTISDLFYENYFLYFKELCNKNGLLYSNEGYGNGTFDNLQASGLADIPMGEFWVGDWLGETVKLAASAAHTNGRKVVGAESFTADDRRGRWLVDPYSIKTLGDKMFCYGVNRYIFHRYTHQPWTGLNPGMTMGPWGMNLERTITWWSQGKEWMEYIARCEALLQSGRFVADVLAFAGEDSPNDPPFLKGSVVPVGYDYDLCDKANFLQLSVTNGRLRLPNGMTYRLLVLPDSKVMSHEVFLKISSLVQSGAIVVGPKPIDSPGLVRPHLTDATVAGAVSQLWGPGGKQVTGLGALYNDEAVDLGRVIKETGLAPDVECAPNLNWIHRRDGDDDIYFVANPAHKPVLANVTFRVEGKAPEIWDPMTGSRSRAPVWESNGERTRLTLPLDPAGSVFVVFRKKASSRHWSKISRLGDDGQEPTPPRIEVLSARYEAVDGTGGVDVSETVRTMVAAGATEVAATNGNFGDPTFNHVKRLVVTFQLNGVTQNRTVGENEVLVFVANNDEYGLPDWSWSENGLTLWKSGTYRLSSSDGSLGDVKVMADPQIPELQWTVVFPKTRGQVTLNTPSLFSWPNAKVEWVKHFSGTATYTTSFDWHRNKSVYLDLGKVKNFAEVTVNGHTFPPLWKAPFRLDVTNHVKWGINKLEVKVTNLWPNRLIGDEAYPPIASYANGPLSEWPAWLGKSWPKTNRTTFTTWRFFDKDAPLLDSGLIGPVRLIPATTVWR